MYISFISLRWPPANGLRDFSRTPKMRLSRSRFAFIPYDSCKATGPFHWQINRAINLVKQQRFNLGSKEPSDEVRRISLNRKHCSGKKITDTLVRVFWVVVFFFVFLTHNEESFTIRNKWIIRVNRRYFFHLRKEKKKASGFEMTDRKLKHHHYTALASRDVKD